MALETNVGDPPQLFHAATNSSSVSVGLVTRFPFAWNYLPALFYPMFALVPAVCNFVSQSAFTADVIFVFAKRDPGIIEQLSNSYPFHFARQTSVM